MPAVLATASTPTCSAGIMALPCEALGMQKTTSCPVTSGIAAIVPHFEEALTMDPDNATIHNNLGIALDELGDLHNAKKHLELAVTIDPQYALAHNNLGIVLAKLGDNEEARARRERAVDLDPSLARVPK